MTEMIAGFMAVFTRIAVALEALIQLKVNDGPADFPPNAQNVQAPDQAAVNEAMHTGVIVTQPEVVDPLLQQTQTAPPNIGAAGVWDPTTSPKQGAYRDKVKQGAIEASMATLGITPARSWSWAKKHQAILDHVAQFGAVSAMTWGTFEAEVHKLAAAGKRDALINAVEQLEGHTVVARINIKPENYQAILDAANAVVDPAAQQPGVSDQDIVTHPVNPTTGSVIRQATTPISENPNTPAGQPADYQPGVTVVNTQDTLSSYARYLMTQGITPQQIQGAIQHIAQGIVYVPVERVVEAFQALQVATGK